MRQPVLKMLPKTILAATLFTSLYSYSNGLPKGEKLYNDNCAACHRVKSFTVGPSLVEISKKYTSDKEQAFLDWTNSPGKINPKTIQMPAMSHLGDSSLKMIHKYILTATTNVKETKSRHGFTPFKKPLPTYPYVKRTYMPFASPAAIAVVLNNDFALSWDAATKRVRYAYPATNVFMSGESVLDKAKKQILYSETSERFWSFANDQKIKYQGYKLRSGAPTFLYKIGDIQISERIVQGKVAQSFIRHYSVTGINSAAVIDLSHKGNANIVVSKGTLKNKQLTLTPNDLTDFSITVTMND
jgi:cytochrome c551/c552